METKDLPTKVAQLKKDLQARIKQFNNETGLYIGGAFIEGIPTENSLDGETLIKMYKVGIDIQL